MSEKVAVIDCQDREMYNVSHTGNRISPQALKQCMLTYIVFYKWTITSKEEAQMCWWSVRTSCPIITWNWPNRFKVWSDNVRWTTVISSRDRSLISANHHLVSSEFQTFTSMSFKLNSRTCSHDTGQQIPCLLIWMTNIKDVVNLLAVE